MPGNRAGTGPAWDAARVAQIIDAARHGYGITVHPGEFNKLALALDHALRGEPLDLNPNPTMENAMAEKKSSKKQEVYAVIANEKYGLYVGLVESYDPTARIVKAREVRHVCQFKSKRGGISSLAVYGLIGADQNIGAPAPSATLTGIVNVIECTPEARATFEAAKQA